ncbi:hypothetical protein F0L68_20075 [Solihabitans fulvus]|uniref:Uncharacterized protein n=1 Tax=Solihabitans fulvus TaxID=1892852 RepID=A0A5B2XB19_9PSEU|nr:hypothetical protein [Solihabitans fulvus]KAA2260436.1 hypothetical protein F0L68_20075 [Solihabitans fulvus]
MSDRTSGTVEGDAAPPAPNGHRPEGTPQAGPRHPDLMSALVTEHFVLQSAASTTVSEATGRASLYLSVLSSALVALGFAAQSPSMVVPFASTVLPALLLLGIFTTVRLVDTGVQNVRYLAGIARIREYYRELDPRAARYFTPWGAGGETAEALASLATKPSFLTGLFTAASMVAAINSIVAGAGAVLVGVLLVGSGHLALLAPCGLLVAVLCMTVFCRYQDARYRALNPQQSKGTS